VDAGAVNHIALTVTDLARAKAFYDLVLGHLGYRQVKADAGMVLWIKSGVGAVLIHPAREGASRHERTAPGLHHLAFAADSCAQVDQLYRTLRAAGATILDAPADYDYTPGYYAVFFADPDGIKLELCHTPPFART